MVCWTSTVFILLILSFSVQKSTSCISQLRKFFEYDDQLEAKDVDKVEFKDCGRNVYDTLWTQYFPFDNESSNRKLRRVKRIVGGKESPIGQWPWIASIMMSGNESATERHHCGGTLIHPLWVLTARHCFEKYGKNLSPGNFTVRLGQHNLTDETAQYQDINVEQIHRYNISDQNSLANDIGLIKLSENVTFTKYINTICLPRSADDPIVKDDMYYVAGWGRVNDNAQNIAPVIRHVKIPIINTTVCFEQYNAVLEFNISTSMFCAGQEGKDACQFDSGGPLMHQVDGQWSIVGIVSLGYECGQVPGIYTKVSLFLSWIKDIISSK